MNSNTPRPMLSDRMKSLRSPSAATNGSISKARSPGPRGEFRSTPQLAQRSGCSRSVEAHLALQAAWSSESSAVWFGVQPACSDSSSSSSVRARQDAASHRIVKQRHLKRNARHSQLF
jgi:hypothetical protein